MKKRLLALIGILVIISTMFAGCASENSSQPDTGAEEAVTVQEAATITETPSEDNKDPEPTAEAENEEVKMEKIKAVKNDKTRGNTNPIMTQAYGADPYAMVYGDTVYFYMTADAYEYDAAGEIKENSYSQIKSIHVCATKDMKNFTDYGEIPVAGKDGIAKWAGNSWAPAAAWKNIDGQDKFFLYFANSGGGIGVLTADTPYGPFTDPLGEALITWATPGCQGVVWMFDPAVLVDDDGTGYLYFGGGVPEGKPDHPMTGRCIQLGDDMISLAGEAQVIDAPFLFEDSGIHKCGDKYCYTYCSNFSVTDEGRKEYGFDNGQICLMESDSPLGPFTFKEMILENPGKLCGLYGNNHHCVFNFNGQWYITYHTRILEKNKGVEHGYRSTSIDAFNYKEDGTIGHIIMTKEGPDQLVYVDPYAMNKAVCVGSMGGMDVVGATPESELSGVGEMMARSAEVGAFLEIVGVDYGEQTRTVRAVLNVRAEEGMSGRISIRTDFVGGEEIGAVTIDGTGEFAEILSDSITLPTGVHYLYFVFENAGIDMKDWRFE